MPKPTGFKSPQDRAAFNRGAFWVIGIYVLFQMAVPVAFFALFMVTVMAAGKAEAASQTWGLAGLAWMILAYLSALSAPLILVFGLDRLGKSHRDPRSPVRGLAKASLLRRLSARLVDDLISVIPLFVLIPAWIFGMVKIAGAREKPESWVFLFFLLLWGSFIAWNLLLALVFAWMESESGKTPGKRLCGIRVLGLDGRPIGFGRALLRRVLILVDGQFSGAVGMLCIAFTARAQRLGDMAAESVVVRDKA